MHNEQGDYPVSRQMAPPTIPAKADRIFRPFIISAILLAYYLGAGWASVIVLHWFPSLRVYFENIKIALVWQASYGLGGVVLSFLLSGAKEISVWLSYCALQRANAGYVVHAFIIGMGLYF